ncbi:MAG: NAD(P)-dependent alcohol dehydrogenase [Acidimicrobiia bacterium]|nr:NAD(P)-dependent alcohol dehydrogenase [Acidimicrobiia bacterium]
MSPSTVQGYAALSAGQLLEPFSYEAPELREHQVRVDVTHCGVCHTDIHAVDGDYGVFVFPIVPGHEIVGRVVETGAAVTGLQLGDRVGIGWQGRCCGRCEWCRAGKEHLCLQIADCGTWTPYGGFSSSVVVDDGFAYPLPADMPAEAAAVIMCAGIAVYPPLRKYSAPGSRVGVVGIGGLGHLALQFAKALGCEVTALSSSPAKEEEARAFGADHFLRTTDRAAMEDHEFGFDVLVCTAPAGNDWADLVMVLNKDGRLVLPAFAPLDIPLFGDRVSGPMVDFVVHQLSITGSFLGSRADMREMLAFAQERGITPQVELMPMSQVNEAMLRVRQNEARYRVVLVNE